MLDLVRILVLNKNLVLYLNRDQNANNFTNKHGHQSTNYYFDVLFKLVREENIVNSMLVLRIFCNLFKSLEDIKSVAVQKLLAFILYEKNFLLPKLFNFLNNNHKMFLISYSTVLLNYVVLTEKLFKFSEKFSSQELNNFSNELIEFFNHPQLCENILNWDPEPIFRVLVSVGTLTSKTNARKETDYLISMFKSIELFKNVCETILFKAEKYPEKVNKSADLIVQLMR